MWGTSLQRPPPSSLACPSMPCVCSPWLASFLLVPCVSVHTPVAPPAIGASWSASPCRCFLLSVSLVFLNSPAMLGRIAAFPAVRLGWTRAHTSARPGHRAPSRSLWYGLYPLAISMVPLSGSPIGRRGTNKSIICCLSLPLGFRVTDSWAVRTTASQCESVCRWGLASGYEARLTFC